MGIKSDDIVPLNQVRARFTELAEEVRAGAEKIVTRNGESYVALVDARRLDHYHRLEREHIHLALLEEAVRGLEDLRDGRVVAARQVLAKYKVKRRRGPRAAWPRGSPPTSSATWRGSVTSWTGPARRPPSAI